MEKQTGEDYSKYIPEYCVKNPEITAEMAAMMVDNFNSIRSGNSEVFRNQDEETDPMTHFGITFYNFLFEAAPQIRHLFKKPIPEQGSKLAAVLAAAIGLVMKPDALVPVLQDIARSHVSKGTKWPHYSVVGTTLLQTLEALTGSAWSPELQNAWLHTYSLMMQVMIPEALKGEQELAAKLAAAPLEVEAKPMQNIPDVATEPPSPVAQE